jgi:pimeloyl-ACP methyl ester carboxylesterase
MPLWSERDPQSRLVVIPNASHCANIDNPGFFNEAALKWLESLAPTS